MTSNLTNYGTVKWYADQFGDILADVDPKSPDYADNILKGFEVAIEEWIEYHSVQTKAYERMKAKFNP